MDEFDLHQLPSDVRSKLDELEVELSEGDITEKGYQKKRQKLLSNYLNNLNTNLSKVNPHYIPSSGAILLPGIHENGAGVHRLNSRAFLTESSICTPGTSTFDPSSSIDESANTGLDYDGDTNNNGGDKSLNNPQRHDEAESNSLSLNSQKWKYIHEDHRYRLATHCSDEDISESSAHDVLNKRMNYNNQKPSSSNSFDVSQIQPKIIAHPSSEDANHTNFSYINYQNNNRSKQLPSDRYDEVPPSLDKLHLNKNSKINPTNPWIHSLDHVTNLVGVLNGSQSTDSFDQMAARAEAQLNLPESSGVELDNWNLNQSKNVTALTNALEMNNNNAYQPNVTQSAPNRFNPCLVGGINVLPHVINGNSNYSAEIAEPSKLSCASNAEDGPLFDQLNYQNITDFLGSDRNCQLSSQPNQPNQLDNGLVCPNRVSEKIQQLVNTLKRPKRYPLPEYFLDDEDQVLIRPVIDPNAPRPRGLTSQFLIGEELVIPSGLPRNLESALQRYASLSCKTPALTCLDVSGRPTQVLTYAKLLQRSIRIAYTLLNKLGHRGEQSLKPGDRVALVYGNNEPISFLCAFYGCIFASVIPITIEVPSNKRDTSFRSMGFLLSSQDIRIVLASEQCYKTLQRGPNGDITTYSSWPRVTWINTDHHASGAKPPRDWTPPDRLGNDTTMYLEYTFGKDGSVHGVMVSRRAALAHCRALTVACSYSEEDVVVCVVDCRRLTGLWHSVLTSVFNGLHVIFVPYSVMQIDPGSWLRMVTKYRASVAIMKSRDMHWALLAERDHPNTNLSSLRMLLVADGSNPWSLNSCDSFVQKFRDRGFLPEAICPSAGSAETLTLCLRRPPHPYNMNTSIMNGKQFPNAQPNSASALAAAPSSVRGVISIQCLTYGVVRVDSEDSLTSLTLQDCGQVLPGACAVVVRLGPKSIICQTDELGEICLASDYTGSGYWGLRGQTDAHFHVEPLNEDGTSFCTSQTRTFTRSGFLGFPGPASSGGLIFISGSIDGLMTIASRRHNADDLIATVLAVQPTKIVYRGRIAIFSVDLLKDERLVIVAELRQGYSDEAAFTWMSLVLQAVDSIHQVSVYCLALVNQNTLPRTPFGGINQHSVKQLFSEGNLHPTALLLCPHSAIQNLPQPRQLRPSLVGPSAMMVGQVVQGVRMAEARGRPLGLLSSGSLPVSPSAADNMFQFLTEILSWRASQTPDERLFTVYNAKGQEASTLTCNQLLRRAERIAAQLQEKVKATSETVVALLYPPGTELICAFYACLLIGAIPVPVRPPRTESIPNSTNNSTSSGPFGFLTGSTAPILGSTPTLNVFGSNSGGAVHSGGLHHSQASQSSSLGSYTNVGYFRSNIPTLDASMELVWNVVKHSEVSVILTQSNMIKFLKSKEATSRIPFSHWPTLLDSEDNGRRKFTGPIYTPPNEQSVAYLDFAPSTTGTLTGIRVTHQVVHALCRAQKVQCEFYPTREVVLSLDPYSSLGFTLYALISIHCGHHSILVPPSVSEAVPDLWFTICSQRKVRDAFCSHFTIELSTRYMAKQMSVLKSRDISLASLRSLVIVAEERPRVKLTSTFIKLCANLGLASRALSTSFGCRVNLVISLQGASSPESSTVYVDRVSLRNDRVKLLEKGSPHSLCLMECGKLLPGVHVAIANPETLGQCSDSQLGEIWVSSSHNSTELMGPFDSASLNRSPGTVSQPVPGTNLFNSLAMQLATGDKERLYARTGYLGFVRRTDLTQSDGELHDAIFVVGSLEEAILLRGMRFHPVDIESTVMRAHRKICECAVFTWSNLLVVISELAGEEHEAMDLVHPITAHVLSEHQLIVGVVVIVDPGTVLVNSCGEKQRILLRDTFVNDKLDPIYVSYNM